MMALPFLTGYTSERCKEPEIGIERLISKEIENCACFCSILLGTVKAQNIDGYREIYDKMRIVEPKAEDNILRRFMRTSTHAARNHRERVGAIVARLFEHTTDMEV